MKRMLGAGAMLFLQALASPAIAQNAPAPSEAQTVAAAEPVQGPQLPAVTPRRSIARAALALSPPTPSQSMIVGGWSPVGGAIVGVGLFAIPKSATADPQEARRNPMKDPTGKTRRIAAVGVSLSF